MGWDCGGPPMAGVIRREQDGCKDCLLVQAGDVVQGSPVSTIFKGLPVYEILNLLRFEAGTFGNHEFELSRDTLVARIHLANFKWLSANCREANGDAFPGVLSWDTLRLAGRKVGIFGLTLQGDYPAYVRCSDPDSAARLQPPTHTGTRGSCVARPATWAPSDR